MVWGFNKQVGTINKLVIVSSEVTGMHRDIHNRGQVVLDDEYIWLITKNTMTELYIYFKLFSDLL